MQAEGLSGFLVYIKVMFTLTLKSAKCARHLVHTAVKRYFLAGKYHHLNLKQVIFLQW